MNEQAHQKVRADHLKRGAYLYIRQSTLQQVVHNTESTQRQYGLRQRATALGWPAEQVNVIDTDQGQSGASAADREGFQKLVTEVSMGRAGIVLGLEVSRLARNSADWHRLLEICALTDTLILDEDGLYDPAHFNDRMLLGLKGALSEAELHVLHARLQGGKRNKARRGELRLPLPAGLVYDPQGRVVLDPDRQVQQAVRTLFADFQRTGSAGGTVRYFREHGLLFPRRDAWGQGDILWQPLGHDRVLRTLHNPRYTGAFFYGRHRFRKTPDGRTHCQILPQDQWHTLLLDAHPGYITWEQYQDNCRILEAQAQAYGLDRRRSPPGQGPALLQGLAVCGRCGQRMTVRYDDRRGRVRPLYACQQAGIESGQGPCQVIQGSGIDHAIGQLLLEMVTPVSVQVAWAVQQELQSQVEEADRLRKQQVERAQYEADQARHRYMQVDPANRLVADSLEANWNEKLRALAAAQEDYQRQSQADRAVLNEDSRQQLLALAGDFPKLWSDPQTTHQDRKRMVRLLIEDVTLIKAKDITVSIRFKGGATRILTLPRPLPAFLARKTNAELVAEVDRLLDQFTEGQAATALNNRNVRTGTGKLFNIPAIKRIRTAYKLACRYDRLRQRGLLSQAEIAQQLSITEPTVIKWRKHGLLRGALYNDKRQYLYEPIGENGPVKNLGQKLSERRRFPELDGNPTDGVQHEA